MKLERKDNSVNIWGLEPEMQPVLAHASKIWENLGYDELVVTSARDGIHSCGSFHYYGFAVDLRTWDHNDQQWTDEVRQEVAQELRARLAEYSEYYDVVAHKTHIHIEYDWIRARAS